MPDGRRLLTGAASGEFTLWNGVNFNYESILQVSVQALCILHRGTVNKFFCVVHFALFRLTMFLFGACAGVTMESGWCQQTTEALLNIGNQILTMCTLFKPIVNPYVVAGGIAMQCVCALGIATVLSFHVHFVCT